MCSGFRVFRVYIWIFNSCSRHLSFSTFAKVHIAPNRLKIRVLQVHWLTPTVFGTCRAKRLGYLGIGVVDQETSPPLAIAVVMFQSGSRPSGVWSRVRIRIRERTRIRILLLMPAPSSLHTPSDIMGPRRTHRKSRNGCPQCKARRLKVFRPDYLTPRSTRVAHATSVTNDIHARIASNMAFTASLSLGLSHRRQHR